MTRAEIIAELRARADQLKAMGATHLYMFGSRARGDERPESDLDLFIDYDPKRKPPGYFQLFEFRLRLEDGLQLPVHLGTRASLDEAIRKDVEAQAVRVF